MVTSRQLKLGSLALYVVALVMLISALAVPKFLVGSFSLAAGFIGPQSVDVAVSVGAIHVCADVKVDGGRAGSAILCSTISSKCTATFQGQETDPSLVESCRDFNAFRGLLITGTVLASVALIVGVANLCLKQAPRWTHALVIFSSLLSVLFIIISLLAFTNSAYEGSVVLDGVNAKVEKGASVYLEGVGVALLTLAVIIWLGAFRQSVTEASTDYGAVGAPGVGQPILAAGGAQYDPRYAQQQYYAAPSQYAEQYTNAPPQQPMQYATPDVQLRQPLTQA